MVHAAGTVALRAGATVERVLEVGAALAPRLPVVAMTYTNIVYSRGVENFAAALEEAGISGLIVPDLPLEEAVAVLEACDARGVALVPLVAPTTPDERLAQIGARARGFVYTVSVSGTTGERTALAGRRSRGSSPASPPTPTCRWPLDSGSPRRSRPPRQPPPAPRA